MPCLSEKKCFKCGRLLDRSQFYRHPQMDDGLLGKCKDCARRDVIVNRQRRIDYYRRYDILRARLPHRRALNARVTKVLRQIPLFRRAHDQVRYAVARGKISKSPCLVCGSIKVVAHHENYKEPLKVMWLCSAHHSARHKELRLEGKDPLLAARIAHASGGAI